MRAVDKGLSCCFCTSCRHFICPSASDALVQSFSHHLSTFRPFGPPSPDPAQMGPLVLWFWMSQTLALAFHHQVNRCILRFDHFSRWIDNPIGRRNHRACYWFVLSLFCSLAVLMYLTLDYTKV